MRGAYSAQLAFGHCRSACLARALRPLRWLLLLSLLALTANAWAQQKVRVGVYQNSPKVSVSEQGKPEGIFIDLIESVAEREGWQIEYVQGTWAEGLARLGKGTIDLMPDVARTSEREALYAFHQEPVLASWNQVYARRNSGVRSMLDLQSKTVAVVEGSVQHALFQQMAEAFNLPVTLVTHADYDAAFAAVARGQADAVITNRFFGVRNAAKYGLEDTAIIFSPSTLFFAAPKKGHDAMLAAVDRHLIELKKDSNSVYYRSLRNWAVDEVRAATPGWLVPVLTTVVLVLAASAAWLVLLRRQVAAKTREIRRRNEEILIVNRTLRATGSRRELSAVLDEATKGALALTGFDGGVLCVRDAKRGMLRVGARLQALAETIAGYNQALAHGRAAQLDPPRSSRAGTLAAQAWPVQGPDFMAIRLCAGITYTMGGIAIDASARVRAASDGVIDGLYAAGSTTGGLDGGEDSADEGLGGRGAPVLAQAAPMHVDVAVDRAHQEAPEPHAHQGGGDRQRHHLQRRPRQNLAGRGHRGAQRGPVQQP